MRGRRVPPIDENPKIRPGSGSAQDIDGNGRIAALCKPMRLRNNLAGRRLRANSGFTLLEGVVGVGLMGVLIVCLYTGMTTGFSTVRLARENLRATQVIQEKFE